MQKLGVLKILAVCSVMFGQTLAVPSCIMKCGIGFASEVGADIAGDDLMPFDNGHEPVRVALLAAEHKCSAYHTFESCAEACNDAATKNIAMKGLRGVKFFCQNVAEYKKQMPCVVNTTAAYQCANQIEAMKKATAEFVAIVPLLLKQTQPQPADIWDQFKYKLGHLCGTIHSETTCVLPVVYPICGNFTVNLANGMFSEALKGFQSMADDGAFDVGTIPSQCHVMLETDYASLIQKTEEAEVPGQKFDTENKKIAGNGTLQDLEPVAAKQTGNGGEKLAKPGFESVLLVMFSAIITKIITTN